MRARTPRPAVEIGGRSNSGEVEDAEALDPAVLLLQDFVQLEVQEAAEARGVKERRSDLGLDGLPAPVAQRAGEMTCQEGLEFRQAHIGRELLLAGIDRDAAALGPR